MGGKFPLKLNAGQRPIAHKYSDRTLESTLERESKMVESVSESSFDLGSRRDTR
jgi:hypothetical protein